MKWHNIPASLAKDIDCRLCPEPDPPLNENGEPCPWPREPQQMTGPLGQYHCRYCGAMVLAGVRHVDYRGIDEVIGSEDE